MAFETSQSSEQTILIIDDNPTNLGVLAGYLEDFGFTTLVARDGESGIDKAEYAQPDVILLDVMMPGINGFEACRRLKENEETKEIPVIFMTALAQTEHKVHGFRMGAVDYVTKPLNQEEVLARVNTHIKIRNLTKQLQTANNQLIKLNADKDKFFSIVAHDLKGPFLPLLGNAELLASMATNLSPAEVAKMSNTIHRSAERVLDLLNNLLQWSRLQMGRMEYNPLTLEMSQIIDSTLTLLKENAKKKNISLNNQITTPIHVRGDIYMVDTIIRNLVSNALKFTHKGGNVSISAELRKVDALHASAILAQPSFVEFSIADTGVGIKPEYLETLFDIGTHHSTLGTAQEQGTGLGLIMCREMVQRNGGKLWAESEVGQGSTFKFTLPLANPPESTPSKV